jgi:hypothetical protein
MNGSEKQGGRKCRKCGLEAAMRGKHARLRSGGAAARAFNYSAAADLYCARSMSYSFILRYSVE